ncbi:MAG: D-alanine--D-alanine ligase [Firmicutes bacterium]|nr:D-alanine--D-alanine ligase [Bacillota bacterium]
MQSVILLFGGVSSEHVISCKSAQTFMTALLADDYTVYPVYIDRSGRWFLYEGDVNDLAHAPWCEYAVQVSVIPGGGRESFVAQAEDGPLTLEADVVIPVLHGLNGEDGTVQGLLELARIPYVGCGVLASAVSMDKVFTKLIVKDLGIPQAEYVDLTRRDIQRDPSGCADRVEAKLAYPVFVKPSRAGSSVGVSQAANRDELFTALQTASKEDRRVLVEETIVGREVECAVLGDWDAEASLVGEILAADTFYSFDAKYVNAASRTVVPAEMDVQTREQIREYAKAIFHGVDGWGLARVDFFIRESDGRVIFNEINTFPGFTSISMWPMLWKERGLELHEQVARLVQSAMEREISYGS